VCLLEVGQEAWCTICKFHKIQDFYGQGSTYKNALQASECYSPTSSQARVLVVQASVAAYLKRFAVKLFSYNLVNARKRRNDYRRATYKDNFLRVLNQEFFFWFTSSGFCKQPILFEVLAPVSLFLRGSHMQRQYCKRTTLRSKSSTIKGLLYAPDPDNRKKGMLSDQPRLLRVTSMAFLCCWGCSRSKI
jgi:hypothetical protein